MRLIDADKLHEDINNGPGTSLQKFFANCCVAAAPTVNPYEWISVDDRLPPKYETVLVFCNGVIRTDWIRSNKEWYDHHGIVAHWMPLPTPPTEKGK